MLSRSRVVKSCALCSSNFHGCSYVSFEISWVPPRYVMFQILLGAATPSTSSYGSVLPGVSLWSPWWIFEAFCCVPSLETKFSWVPTYLTDCIDRIVGFLFLLSCPNLPPHGDGGSHWCVELGRIRCSDPVLVLSESDWIWLKVSYLGKLALPHWPFHLELQLSDVKRKMQLIHVMSN